jgi:hypothetical protein
MAKVVDAGVEMGDFLVNLGLAEIEVALCRRQTATNSRTLLSHRLLSEILFDWSSSFERISVNCSSTFMVT